MNALSPIHPLVQGCVLAVVALAAAMGGRASATSRPGAELRAQAEVAGDTIAVGDIALLHGVSSDDKQRLAALPVAAAPRTGQVGRVNRAQLLATLPAGWSVDGAAVVTIRRTVQPLKGDRLCAVAIVATNQRLDALGPAIHHGLECMAEAGGAIDVPAGTLALTADLSRLQMVDGPQRAAVDVTIDGRLERSVPVTLKLSLTARQWCARRPLASAESIEPSAFDTCLVPVRHPTQLETAGAPLPAGRTRRPLHAGDPIAATDVADSDTALAGDAVEVRYRSGGFELESSGALLQDARVGSPVRVRISQATQPVIGHLASAHLVELEDQP